MNPTFTIVDVFAEEKYAGNQLAVVRGAAGLPDETLKKITREMNYSETTFILSEGERDGAYDVRVFTPGMEIPFAGHPTLGHSGRFLGARGAIRWLTDEHMAIAVLTNQSRTDTNGILSDLLKFALKPQPDCITCRAIP